MNREIEFRFWSFASERMMDWSELKTLHIGTLFDKEVSARLMQFTGLHDKNGVKIFEGDIVKWDDCSDGKYWRVAIVQINPDIKFKCINCPAIQNSSAHGHTFKFGSFIYTDTHNHLYVIGNTHANPELLEKK